MLNVDDKISVSFVNFLMNMLSRRLLDSLTSSPRLVSPLSSSTKANLAAERKIFLVKQTLFEEVKRIFILNKRVCSFYPQFSCGLIINSHALTFLFDANRQI